jgi:hypothetical protein
VKDSVRVVFKFSVNDDDGRYGFLEIETFHRPKIVGKLIWMMISIAVEASVRRIPVHK